MKLPLIPLDKANHIIYGLVIYVLSNFFLQNVLALCVVTLFAVCTEMYDYWSYGKFDIEDMFATIFGAAILTIIYT